jgi:hypothetical protein
VEIPAHSRPQCIVSALFLFVALLAAPSLPELSNPSRAADAPDWPFTKSDPNHGRDGTPDLGMQRSDPNPKDSELLASSVVRNPPTVGWGKESRCKSESESRAISGVAGADRDCGGRLRRNSVQATLRRQTGCMMLSVFAVNTGNPGINPVPPARKSRSRSEFSRAARDLVGVKCKDIVSLLPG